MEREIIVESIQDENKNIENIKTFVSEKLADIVVLNRYLGIYEAISKSAMEELANRRINGDQFEYEKYISSNLEQLPKINIKMPEFKSLYKIISSYIKL